MNFKSNFFVLALSLQFVISSSLISFGQTFQTQYAVADTHTWANRFSFANNGDILVAGYYGWQMSQTLMMRMDSNGNLLWAKSFILDAPAVHSILLSESYTIHEDASGYLYMTGHADSSAFALKTNSAGNLIWAKCYDARISSSGWHSELTSSGLLLTGQADSITANIMVLKIDVTTGNLIFGKLYDIGGDTLSDIGWNVCETPSGDLMIAGTTNVISTGDEDFFAMKLNSIGNLIWVKTYTAPNNQFCTDLHPFDSWNKFVLAGYSNAITQDNAMLLMIDSSGNFIWSNTYDGFYSWYPYWGIGITEAPDGGVVLAAEIPSAAQPPTDGLLLKTFSNGNLDWARVLYPPGSIIQDGFHHVEKTATGYVVSGWYSQPNGFWDVAIVKTDFNGMISGTCQQCTNPAVIAVSIVVNDLTATTTVKNTNAVVNPVVTVSTKTFSTTTTCSSSTPNIDAEASKTVICIGDSSTLTATSVISNYFWQPGGATSQSVTVGPTSTTTYTLIVTDPTNGCVYRDSVKIIVNPIQIPSPVACYNFAGNLNESNGGAPLVPINGLGSYSTGAAICGIDSFYNWTVGQGLDLPIGTIFPKNHYSLELLFKFTSVPYQRWWQRIVNFKNSTDDLGLYTYEDNWVVPPTYNLQMYLQYEGTTNIAKPNTWFRLFLTRDSVTDIVNGYINNNLEFSFPDTLFAGVFISDLILFKDDIVVPDEESDGTIDYLRIYDVPLNECQIAEIISVSTPTITASNNVSICSGESTTLSVSGAATNYAWNTGATTSSISVSPTSTGTYTVIAWNYLFCTKSCNDTSLITVTVNSLPVVSISGNTSLCTGNSTTLTASGGSIYSWNTGATTSAITVNPTSLTSYSVSVTNLSGCTGNASATVTMNPLPTASINGNSTLCAGQTTTLTASGGVNYSWLNSGATTNPITYSPTALTSYTVVATDSNGCTDDAIISVSVNPLPAANAGPDVSICTGSTITLNASGNGAFLWSPSTGLTCTSCSNPAANLSSTTSYTLSVTNSCGSINDGVIITINPTPSINAGPDVTVCSGNSITLNAIGSGTFAWSPSAGLNCSTCSNPSATPTSSTHYTVTITDVCGTGNDSIWIIVSSPSAGISGISPICNGNSSTLTASGGSTYLWGAGGQTTTSIVVSPTTSTTYTITTFDALGCAAMDTLTVVLNSLPTAMITGNTTVCAGLNDTLVATGGTGYLWNTGVTSDTLILNLTSTANYTVTVTDGNGCINTTNISVVVVPQVIANAGPDVTICTGGITTLNGAGNGNYSWTPLNGLSNSTVSNPVASPTVTSTYSLFVTNACGTATDVMVITVNPMPTIAAIGNSTICAGSTDTLYVTGSTPYAWSTGETTSAILVSPTATTIYSVSATNNCGLTTATVTVLVFSKPSANFTYKNDPCNVACIQFVNSSVNGSTWWWDMGDGGTSSSESPCYQFSAPSIYTVSLIANPATLCPDTFSLPVAYPFNDSTASPLIIPNVFSPNGDGFNDVFKVTGSDHCAPYLLSIYDRWGVLVFETSKTGFVWDGRTTAGLQAEAGTFYYILLNKASALKGFVTLLR